MATPLSKLDHFKLETRYGKDYAGKDYVENDTYVWKYSSKWATGVKRWTRVKMIGEGGFASVWLEKEASGHELRAVKVIQRHIIVNTGFTQELATLVTLSDVCTTPGDHSVACMVQTNRPRLLTLRAKKSDLLA